MKTQQSHERISPRSPYFRLPCVPGEKAAGGVGEVRLDGRRKATGGDLKVYPTVVGLQVNNHS